jgi:hypothetical protein
LKLGASFGVASSLKYSAKRSRCSSGIHTVFSPFLMQSGKIFQEGRVAQSFKTGVITPILKKSKDQMLTENYRGITITSPLFSFCIAFFTSSMITIIFFFSSDFDISLISLNRLSLSFKWWLLKLGASFGVASSSKYSAKSSKEAKKGS